MSSMSDDEHENMSISSGPSFGDHDSPAFDHRQSRSASIISTSAPDTTRAQLKEDFLATHFPAGVTNDESDFMYSKFLSRDMLHGIGPTMQTAIEALCLLYLGAARDDEGLVQQGRVVYNEAVAIVNYELINPTTMYNDDVLGAIYILGFCEVHDHSQRGAWLGTHHRGLRDLLIERGPNGQYSRFMQLLIYNFRHVLALVGVAERKKAALDSKAWKQCSALTDSYMSALSELYITLPDVLERADKAMHRPRKNSSELLALLAELVALERDAQAWILSWYSSFPGLPYRQDRIDTFKHFTQHVGSAPPVLRRALRFPSFSQASAHVSYWTIILQIKQTMLELNAMFPMPVLPKSNKLLLSEANECADNLCESIAWLSQPRHGFCGHRRISTLLQHPIRWYAAKLDLQKLAWCEKVERSIQKPGIGGLSSMSALSGEAT